MQPLTFPVPPSLEVLLKAAGFRPGLIVERADGRPLSAADQTLVAAMVAAHGDAELCEALADNGLIPRHGPSGAATGTEGR